MTYLKRQIRFTIEDIGSNKGFFTIGMVQVIVAALVICYVVSISMIAYVSYGKISNMQSMNNVYGIKDLSTELEFGKLFNDETCLTALQNLEKQLTENKKIVKVTLNNSKRVNIESKNLPSEKLTEVASGMYDLNTTFDTLRVSPNFFGFFNISVNGNLNKQGESIPILLGDDYRSFYKKGDIVTDVSDVKYRVAGFLDRDSYYISPFEGKNAVNLNGYIVMYEKLDRGSSVSLVCNIKNSLYYDNDGSFNKIIDKVRSSGLINFKAVSLNHQLHQCITDIENELITMVAIALLILIFATIGIISYFGQYIDKRMREFAIHMICGGEKRDIMLRLLLQIVLIVGAAVLISNIAFKFKICTLYADILLIIYGMGLTWYLQRKLKNTSIVSIVRRETI